MATFVVDTTGVETHISEFPLGPIEATVHSVKADVSKKGGAMLVLELKLYHPDHGEAIMKDWLPQSFPAKVKAFWMAINDFTQEQMNANPVVEINPPDLVGAQLIIQLGEQESEQDGKTYKRISPPWYYPISRADLLSAGEDAPL